MVYLAAVGGSTGDDAVGPVLNAQEVERRIGVVSPGALARPADAQDRAFLDVDALAIHQELAPAADHDVDFVVLLVPVQERDALTRLDRVQ
jgi:hypothetical protein